MSDVEAQRDRRRALADAISIVGVGETEYSRKSGRTPAHLAVEAINAALADAGLERQHVDGVIAYLRSVPVDDIASAIGVGASRFTGVTHMGGASSVEGLELAAMAIASGLAETLVVYIARNGASGDRIADRVAGRLPGRQLRTQLEAPYGWTMPAQWFSMICRRHMHEYGTTKEHLGAVAVTTRAHAQLNLRAMMRGRPLTMEQYLASEPISEPYSKLDCCLESDGAAAVVVTSRERARGLRKMPVRLAGIATGRPEFTDDLVGRTDWFKTGVGVAAPPAFEMAGLRPSEMDAAMIYDCFTFEVIHQLEEAGFCGEGEGGPFAASGAIALGGKLPLNTSGGLLSEAHMLGMNHIIEAVRQLRGECGERQIPDASKIAVVGWGGMAEGAVGILRSDRA